MSRSLWSWLSPYLLAYLVIYAALALALNKIEHFDLGEALLVFAVVGLGFSFLAWLVTRKSVPLPFLVKQPGGELLLLVGYLLVLAAYLTWGHNPVHGEPWKSVAGLGIKLALFVFVPAGLFRAVWKYKFDELIVISKDARQHVWPAIWMSLVLVAFQMVFGKGLGDLQHSGLSGTALAIGVPLVFLFLLVEVGLVEEFFFRVLLQSRLAARLKSEMGGIVVMSLLFGLAHAPGLYLRTGAMQEGVGAHPSLLMAVGYSVVITSVAGFFLGVLWARTRNLPLLMVVHAAGDFVPNLVPMLKSWF
jgi:membrane protease YdiL (CAAX protease family)